MIIMVEFKLLFTHSFAYYIKTSYLAAWDQEVSITKKMPVTYKYVYYV